MNDLVAQATSLPGLIDRAAMALTNARSSAEVLEARDMASVAYDVAKKTARLARAKKAHDDLIAAAYRAQADALEIESQAKRRLADEYDAAQERGEVASRGYTGHQSDVPNGNVIPSAADIGLTRKDIHEARQIREAEVKEPGIVRRALDQQLKQGKEPSKAALNREIKEKLGKLVDAKQKHDEKLATLPSKEEALEISKREGGYVKASDGQSYIYVDPAETAQYDVWLAMAQHVRALAEPQHSAKAFAASADAFNRPRFPAVIDAAISYLTEVKRLLEESHDARPSQVAAE